MCHFHIRPKNDLELLSYFALKLQLSQLCLAIRNPPSCAHVNDVIFKMVKLTLILGPRQENNYTFRLVLWPVYCVKSTRTYPVICTAECALSSLIWDI